MIKKLDKLILKAFVGPFIATFLISTFVLVMQYFWLWIDDLVGKGLDFITIMKFIGLVAAITVPLALPLSMLLSSIMTFGKLGESFELVAIKSAGISLERFMRPLLIVAIFMCGVAFLFTNNIIPVVNLTKDRMLYDIITSKPALNIKVGSFYNKIEGFVIRVGYKNQDSKHIGNVVIFEKNNGLQDNLLTAKSGIMEMTPDKLSMNFVLNDGYHYEESGPSYSNNTQFTRMHFQTYKKSFDMSSFKLNKSNDDVFKYNPQMLSFRQLIPAIDSLKRLDTIYTLRAISELKPYTSLIQYQDSSWQKYTASTSKLPKSYLSTLSDSIKNIGFEQTISLINRMNSGLGFINKDYESLQKSIRSHEIELNRKFTLSIACIILFMIGAPLGSIIRKGGLGSPLVFSIIFFVIFYLLNTIGERLARQEVVSSFVGMWLSTFVLLPIGLFLTYKAMHDSQLFNNEAYFRAFRKIKLFFNKKAHNEKATN